MSVKVRGEGKKFRVRGRKCGGALRRGSGQNEEVGD